MNQSMNMRFLHDSGLVMNTRPVAAPWGESSRRLPDGTVFVPALCLTHQPRPHRTPRLPPGELIRREAARYRVRRGGLGSAAGVSEEGA